MAILSWHTVEYLGLTPPLLLRLRRGSDPASNIAVVQLLLLMELAADVRNNGTRDVIQSGKTQDCLLIDAHSCEEMLRDAHAEGCLIVVAISTAAEYYSLAIPLCSCKRLL